MNDVDQLLWQALEGGLGTKKASWLRTAALSDIVGARHDKPEFTIADAAGHLAKTAREKKSFHRKTAQGLRALREVIGHADMNASPLPYKADASINRKLAMATKLRIVEEASSAPALTEKTAALRRVVDRDIFDHMTKVATSPLASVAKSDTARDMAKSLGKGFAGAAGASVPLYMAGSALSDKATDDARDKALQTAAGVGGMAMLGYGANRMMDNAAYRQRHPDKYASAQDDVMEKVGHLMTTMYIDAFLAQVDQTEKVAELREINRDYGVSVLCALESSSR